MSDIRNFQSNYNTFNKNGFVDQVFTMTKLVYESEKRRKEHPDQPNFDIGYLPKMQYENINSFKDVFLYTKEKIFGIEGAQCIRFILLDKHGNIYENLGISLDILGKDEEKIYHLVFSLEFLALIVTLIQVL